MSCSVSKETGLRTARGGVRVISMCIRPVIALITRRSLVLSANGLLFHLFPGLKVGPSDAFRSHAIKQVFINFCNIPSDKENKWFLTKRFPCDQCYGF